MILPQFTKNARQLLLLASGLALTPLHAAPKDGGTRQQMPIANLLGIAIPPVLISPPAVSVDLGQLLTLQIGALGDPSNYLATGLPTGLSIDAATGLISGTPTEAGVFTATITASNAAGSSTTPVVITVLPGTPILPIATAPVISGPVTAGGTIGQLLSLQIGASGDPTSYTATGLPAGLSIAASTGLISGTPTQAGVFTVDLTAANAQGTGSNLLTLTVLPADVVPALLPPVITSPATVSGEVGNILSFQVGATGSPTSIEATGLPAGLTIDAATGLIAGTPTQAGLFVANVTATNGAGSTTAPLTISVLAAGGASDTSTPMVDTPSAASGELGQFFSYQIGASGNPTSFGASGLPAGLTVDAATGLISGTPTQTGMFVANVSATNSAGTGAAALNLTIVPAETNPAANPPTVISPVTITGQAGQNLSYQIAATGDPTSYGASGLPAGLTLAPSSGLISGTPLAAGVATASITASNAAGTGTAPLTITVTPASAAAALPQVTITANIGAIHLNATDHGQFALTRTGDTSAILVVPYVIRGSAAAGVDYQPLRGVKKFKVGRTTVHINVYSLTHDLEGADKKTVTVILQPGAAYTLSGNPKSKVRMYPQ